MQLWFNDENSAIQMFECEFRALNCVDTQRTVCNLQCCIEYAILHFGLMFISTFFHFGNNRNRIQFVNLFLCSTQHYTLSILEKRNNDAYISCRMMSMDPDEDCIVYNIVKIQLKWGAFKMNAEKRQPQYTVWIII